MRRIADRIEAEALAANGISQLRKDGGDVKQDIVKIILEEVNRG